MVDLMLDLQRRHGTTLLIATHEADAARRCGRVVGLRDGRVVSDQPPGSAFADC
jgi:putative ABC transport system ATP-binding protein